MKFQLIALFLVLAVGLSLAKPNGRTFNKPAALKHIFGVSQPNVSPVSHADSPTSTDAVIVVQKSKDLMNALIGMSGVSSRVAKQLDQLTGWINSYSFFEFDDKSSQFRTKTPNSEDLTNEINDMLNERRSASMICQNLQIFDALISALSDPSAAQGIQVLLYVYGGAALDEAKSKTLYGLIDKLGAKIHVTQSASSSLCYNQDFNAPELQAIAKLAQYSGGTYSLSGIGSTLLTLPFQYDAKTIQLNSRESCQGTQTETFTVDSNTWTLALYLFGEIEGVPTLTGPNGQQVGLNKIYVSPLDQSFVVGDATSASTKLAAGEWTVTYDMFSSDDTLPCGIRVDAQSSA